MHAVLVVIHLFVAIGLVSLILLQRSEGGALGMGGGPGGLMSGRQAGNVLTKATTALGAVFFLTSIALTVFTNATATGGTVLEQVDPNAVTTPALPTPGASTPALGLPDPTASTVTEQPIDSLPPAEPAPAEPAAPAPDAAPPQP
jgi:preprotein translocase subunit SecG